MTSQAEFWNEAGGAAWVEGQDELDNQLAPFGELALEAAAVHPGDAVLDVGCGCGTTTAQLAALVGASGRVVGLDFSAPMLARARERVTASQVTFLHGDAATVDLAPGSFDLLFSRFGVMFFDDPVRAFAHLRRSLKPTGRISIVVWQSLSANEWVTVPATAVADLVEPPALGGPDEPGPFSMADADRVRTILGGSGYAHVDVSGRETDLTIGGGLPIEAATAFTIDHGPLRRVLADAPADLRAAAADRITAALAPYFSPAGVRLAAAVWVVTARAE